MRGCEQRPVAGTVRSLRMELSRHRCRAVGCSTVWRGGGGLPAGNSAEITRAYSHGAVSRLECHHVIATTVPLGRSSSPKAWTTPGEGDLRATQVLFPLIQKGHGIGDPEEPEIEGFEEEPGPPEYLLAEIPPPDPPGDLLPVRKQLQRALSAVPVLQPITRRCVDLTAPEFQRNAQIAELIRSLVNGISPEVA